MDLKKFCNQAFVFEHRASKRKLTIADARRWSFKMPLNWLIWFLWNKQIRIFVNKNFRTLFFFLFMSRTTLNKINLVLIEQLFGKLLVSFFVACAVSLTVKSKSSWKGLMSNVCQSLTFQRGRKSSTGSSQEFCE